MNLLQIPGEVIDKIKADVSRAVETAILRRNVAVSLSRLKDIDSDDPKWAQMQSLMEE